jgi:TctA family transporter
MQAKRAVQSLIAVLILGMLAPLTGCPSQSQVAALTQVLGNDSAQIAALEGNPALAAQLKADTAAAVVAVNNWKKGTNSQMAIEALNIVIADLNLIPNVGPYAALITFAVGTAQSILALLQPASAMTTPRVKLSQPAPQTAKEFQKQWKAIIAANPQLKAAVR